MRLEARIEAGVLLRRLEQGESLGLPHSRPMASTGKRCHELHEWRIVYRVDVDAIVIGEVFEKKTKKTPRMSFLTSMIHPSGGFLTSMIQGG